MLSPLDTVAVGRTGLSVTRMGFGSVFIGRPGVPQEQAICARHGVPLATAALQFPLAHPAVTSLVIGAKSPEEIDANLAAFECAIPAALWDALREARLIAAGVPIPQG